MLHQMRNIICVEWCEEMVMRIDGYSSRRISNTVISDEYSISQLGVQIKFQSALLVHLKTFIVLVAYGLLAKDATLKSYFFII